MDWKYILSLNFDGLTDEERDDIYNTITWYDFEGDDDIDLRKCKALFRVSQEILKYKGDQVETLFHELEDMAVKQAEEGARRLESESEIRSVRSKKSSTIEFENLEQKYIELKAKYKKIVKNNDKNETEIEKLKKSIKMLEEENRHLQNEIQSIPHDIASESDLSETVKDQQQELVQTIHNKNKQISDLLRDIEEVENENYVLRDKLAKVRDELSVATKEITSMTEVLEIKEANLKENIEKMSIIENDLQIIKQKNIEIQNEKDGILQKFEEFTKNANREIENLKNICDNKDSEIKELRSKLREPSLNSSIPSLPKDENDATSHISAFQKALSDREKQLADVKTKLQIATKEMEKSTEVIKKLKQEKETNNRKSEEMDDTVKELKKQLKIVHDRCQNLHNEISFNEKIIGDKEMELKHLLEKLNESGQSELSNQIQKNHELKGENRMKEKQIISLVKDTNKLQDVNDYLEKENFILREKLGISEDEAINLSSYETKERKRLKELEHLKTKNRKLEEQCIDLRSEIHKLTKNNSSLYNQLCDLGYKPTTKHVFAIRDKTDDKKLLEEENKTLVEENEALRKGMHDILDSINTKKAHSLSEIKSETLEKLLRALDVKHISGWYHPAMRLQAEVHNIEGINSELREQLRKTKIELAKYKSMDDTSTGIDNIIEDDKIDVDAQKLKDRHGDEDHKMESERPITDENIEKYLENLLKVSDEKLSVANHQVLKKTVTRITHVKDTLEKQLIEKVNELEKLKEKLDISEGKFKVLTEAETDEEKVKKIDELVTGNVSMSRKVTFIEKECEQLQKTIDKLKNDLSEAEIKYIHSTGELSRKNKVLENDLDHLKKLNELFIDADQYKELERNLDNLTIKYREQGLAIMKQQDDKSLELKILQEIQQALESDKEELRSQLAATKTKLLLQTVQRFDDKVEKLAQSLAQSEVKEMTERQRANHTNNLYQLVKEQLSKSEERFQEYSKYNEDLLKKNLILQEHLKEAEEKITEFVDKKLFKQLELDKSTLFKETEHLKTILSKYEEDMKIKEKNFLSQKTWNDSKEQELLSLKHQIVDLISISDEKVIITQLNNDVFQCRQSLNYYRSKNKEINDELDTLKKSFEDYQKKTDQEKGLFVEKEDILHNKIKNLKNLLNKQKIQYLGCIPLWSEECFLNNLKILNEEKHEAFLKLYEAKIIENEANILKEQLQMEMDFVKQQKQMLTQGVKDELKNVLNWIQEKKNLQINELRYKRQSEFKEKQLEHLMERVKIQDDQISKLDEELLLWQKNFDAIVIPRENPVNQTSIIVSKPTSPIAKLTVHTISTQTIENLVDSKLFTEPTKPSSSVELSSVKEELMEKQKIIAEKQKHISELKSKISELEMTLSTFRTQIGDKQSQINFYEKHILEMQNKKIGEVHSNGAGGDNINVGMVETPTNNEELLALKASTKLLQDTIKVKEDEIRKYQTLLKVDRDKHSLAAANLQEELKNLQKQLLDEKQKNVKLEESFTQFKPTRAAIDQYVGQVHALEKHTSELHTKLSSLEAQLQSSRQESVRWRTLANDRLSAMEELRRSLEEQHKNELMVYKTDSEKLKELSNDEMNNLKQLLGRHRIRCSGRIDADIQKLVWEKDEKINELSTRLRQMKMEDSKKHCSSDTDTTPKMVDLETSMDMVAKENEILKKRCEQLLTKEKSARDEIRDLKAQLLRKPTSIRSDKFDKNIKEQLQKKVSTLESEVESLKNSLTEQISINETHKIQASQDFDKWKKMKHWQQTAEKLKNKLKEKEAEFEKLQQTNVGYRMLIERLEREKHNLENRIKTLKSANAIPESARELEVMKIENMKLLEDLKNLNSKLEMQHYHSGGLGAAMMQEKLESQERKIAILELAAKGTSEIRSEMERLQAAVSTLQKNNLRLETENLDLKLDLEKSTKDVPQLQQRIQHLESQIEIVNSEHSNINYVETQVIKAETKNIEELERTVFIMKRVVEKLQAENKRLLNGKKPLTERAISSEKTTKEIAHLKEQHAESIKKIKQLEQELSSSKNQLKSASIMKKPDEGKVVALTDELSRVKEQLDQKSILLDKVKVLLHRAAAKEKSLLEEISELKGQKSGAISPIVEETESSSDI